MIIPAKSQFNWLGGFWQEDLFKFQPIRTRYWPCQSCWISDLHEKHKSGRGPSTDHIWQVWLKSVQRFQRRRVKCEKLTDGRLPMTKAHMAYGQVRAGELKKPHWISETFRYASYEIISTFDTTITVSISVIKDKNICLVRSTGQWYKKNFWCHIIILYLHI